MSCRAQNEPDRLLQGTPSQRRCLPPLPARYTLKRIYYFRNGGEEGYFIGSSDCMKRNLESRVEVVTPVEKPDLRARLREILEVQLNDRRSAWDMQADGTYRQRRPVDGQDCRSAQEILIELAAQRQQDRRAAIGRPQALDQAR